MEHHGANIREAGDSASAVEQMRRIDSTGSAEENLDMVILDLVDDDVASILHLFVDEKTRHALSHVLLVVVTSPLQRIHNLVPEKINTDRGLMDRITLVSQPLSRSKLLSAITTARSKTAKHHSHHHLHHTNPNGESTTVAQTCPTSTALAATSNHTNAKDIHVLVIEDNKVNQKVAAKQLEKMGLKVEIANDGEEGVRMVKQHPVGYFGMILMDLFMPNMNGFEATIEIRKWEMEQFEAYDQSGRKREYPLQPRIPIVALTASIVPDIQSKCVETGMDDFLSKPWSPSKFAAVVAHNCRAICLPPVTPNV